MFISSSATFLEHKPIGISLQAAKPIIQRYSIAYTISRSPWERLVSVYREKCVQEDHVCKYTKHTPPTSLLSVPQSTSVVFSITMMATDHDLISYISTELR